MHDSPRVFAESIPSLCAEDTWSRSREDWRLARAARANLLLMGMPQVNPLLSDLESAIRNTLERLLPDLHEPVMSWCPGERLILPVAPGVRTLILHDIGALSYQDQLTLLDWLEEADGQTQVVCTTSAPLLPRIQAGAFLETLYYRLNTVCLNLAAH